MEIMFSRTTHYTVTVENGDLTNLAKHLKLGKVKLAKLVDEGELDSDQCHEIGQWLEDNRDMWEISGGDDTEDMELYA